LKTFISALVVLLVTAPTLAAPTSVELVERPPLAKGMAALPRLAPSMPHAADINLALDKLDAAALSSAQNCKKGKTDDFAWERAVETTMAGPRFVSFLVRENWMCAGAAHPGNSVAALVFDLDSGKLIDWGKALPPRFAAKVDMVDGSISSPVLHQLYAAPLKSDDAECKTAFRESTLTFVLWLDAKNRSVVVDTNDLPRAIQSCGRRVEISLQKLREFGADPAFVTALEAAKAKP
jgi:hypothetical protein